MCRHNIAATLKLQFYQQKIKILKKYFFCPPNWCQKEYFLFNKNLILRKFYFGRVRAYCRVTSIIFLRLVSKQGQMFWGTFLIVLDRCNIFVLPLEAEICPKNFTCSVRMRRVTKSMVPLLAHLVLPKGVSMQKINGGYY